MMMGVREDDPDDESTGTARAVPPLSLVDDLVEMVGIELVESDSKSDIEVVPEEDV